MLLFNTNNISAGSKNFQKESISSKVGKKETSLIMDPKTGDNSKILQKRRYIAYSTVIFFIFQVIACSAYTAQFTHLSVTMRINSTDSKKKSANASLHCLEAHIKTLYRVSERTYRNKVDTAKSIVAKCIEGYTAR